MGRKISFVTGLLLLGGFIGKSQGQDQLPPQLQYTGEDSIANISYHDGQMRPAIGTHNYQVLRANRDHPEWADEMGWTYNHAPMLAYWNGHFLVQYLTNTMGEHVPPGVTMLARSGDGMEWEKPELVFPVYYTAKPGGKYPEIEHHYMHQRMGFYVAPDGRLLVMGHYGGNNGIGIGRVVREVYEDFTMGPIYFIRLNQQWEDEVKYPLYHESDDKGFIMACEFFMSDPVRRIQWWEEDFLAPDADSFYMPYERGKAFCFYTISDSLTIGLFKSRLMTYTRDGGHSWAEPYGTKGFTYSGAKIWGQKLENGKYAVVYNPTDASERHPLCVAVSQDGLHFDGLAVVHGEIPVKRYWGVEKRPGPQYVRGIVEGNGDPPGDDLWVVYSVSKEDIWISRIPFPIERTVEGPVRDDFDLMETGRHLPGWNIYSPRWCPVQLVDGPTSGHKSLAMHDKDPFDYARATRVFGQAERQTVSFSLYVDSNPEQFQMDICDAKGLRLIKVRIESDGQLFTSEGERENQVTARVPVDRWVELDIDINSKKGEYSLHLEGEEVCKGHQFSANGKAERIDFRTGEYRLDRKIQEYKIGDQSVPGFDESRPGEPVKEAVLYLRDFSTAFTK
jgi:hypothetical protein